MVIPFAAGGPTDVLGRVVGAKMGEMLGQQVVIENVTGAGGQTGSQARRRSAARRLQLRHRHRRHPRPGARRSTRGRSTIRRPISPPSA